MMKLFAFRDRKEDEDKDLGRHHALDLYTIVAMQVESEYQESLRLGNLYGKDDHVQAAREIIRKRFCRADEYRRDSPSRASAVSAGVSCSRLPRCPQ